MKKVPEVGDKVTIRMTALRDRSYQNEVWEVVAVNETHAKLRSAQRLGGTLPAIIIVVISEYEFSDANHF